MHSFALLQFAWPHSLSAVEPEHLRALLTPYRDYMKRRGIEVNAIDHGDGDADADAEPAPITMALVSRSAWTPSALIDDLYFVSEMANPAAMQHLLRAAEAEGLALELSAPPSPSDVAVQMRVLAPDLMERIHAESVLFHNPIRMEIYPSRPGVAVAYRRPSLERQRDFELALDAWICPSPGGRPSRLVIEERAGEVAILVRRSDSITRQLSIEGEDSPWLGPTLDSTHVLKYAPDSGHLFLQASPNPRITSLFRELAGELLFGDRGRFPALNPYALEPLRRDGEAALICADVEGLKKITLTELRVFLGGAEGEIQIFRARNVFGAFRDRRERLPPGRLVSATFRVSFTGGREPLTVVVEPESLSETLTDADSARIREWLGRRGFVTSRSREEYHANLASNLACA